MKKIIATCKCTNCDSKFEVNNYNFTKCPNNCCSVRVDEYGEDYNTINDMTNCFEVFDRKIFRDPEDYIIPNEKCREIINFLKLQRKEVDYYLCVSEDKCESGKTYIDYISFEVQGGYYDGVQGNYFKCYIDFKNEYDNSLEKIYNRLVKLKEFVMDLKDKKIDLTVKNRNYLKDRFEWSREQVELYDYTFYITEE